MSRAVAVNVNFGQSVQSLLNTVARAIPKIAVFLMILVIGYFIARGLRSIIQKVLERLRFDSFAQRGVVGQAMSRSSYTPSSLVATIGYYALLLLVLQMAFGVFGANPISRLLSGIVAWLPKAAVAIILIVVASAIAKVVKDLIDAALSGLSYGHLLATAASVLVLIIGAVAALNQIGVATAVTMPVLVTVLGTVGAVIAIGVGGGLIKPMQSRWERVLNAAERETTSYMAAYQRGRQAAAARSATASGGEATEQLVRPGAAEPTAEPGGERPNNHDKPEPGGSTRYLERAHRDAACGPASRWPEPAESAPRPV